MILLQIRLRQRQVRLHHIHRRVPQQALQAPRVAPVAQGFDRKRVPEPVHVGICHPGPLPAHPYDRKPRSFDSSIDWPGEFNLLFVADLAGISLNRSPSSREMLLIGYSDRCSILPGSSNR